MGNSKCIAVLLQNFAISTSTITVVLSITLVLSLALALSLALVFAGQLGVATGAPWKFGWLAKKVSDGEDSSTISKT